MVALYFEYFWYIDWKMDAIMILLCIALFLMIISNVLEDRRERTRITIELLRNSRLDASS